MSFRYLLTQRIFSGSLNRVVSYGRFLLQSIVLLGIAIAHPVAAWDHICQPTEVAAFPGRIHVRCKDAGVVIGNIPTGGAAVIRYFALSTKDAAQSARALSLATTAFISEKKLGINYNKDVNDVSGVSIGCRKHDCRLIRAISILQ